MFKRQHTSRITNKGNRMAIEKRKVLVKGLCIDSVLNRLKRTFDIVNWVLDHEERYMTITLRRR